MGVIALSYFYLKSKSFEEMGQDHSKSKEEKVQQKHVKGDAATSSDREAAHVDSRTDEAFRRLAAGDAYIHYKRLVVSFQIYSAFLAFPL